MALALAESLADCGALDTRDLMDRFVRWRSGYFASTMEAAFWSVARISDYRGAILLAANLADDADTVAAVAGQLAGALYGLGGIPDNWLGRVTWKDRLMDVAERLASRDG